MGNTNSWEKIGMIGEQITLNDTEQKIAKMVALSRLDSNNSRGVKDIKVGKQSVEFIDIEGFAGEMAFCKLFNTYPDFSINPRSTDTDAGDTFVNGFAIDVKVTKYPNGKLLAAKWKKPNVDFFALMIGEMPTYTYMGVMRSEDLLHPDKITDLGYGDTYVAYQRELVELPNKKGGLKSPALVH